MSSTAACESGITQEMVGSWGWILRRKPTVCCREVGSQWLNYKGPFAFLSRHRRQQSPQTEVTETALKERWPRLLWLTTMAMA